MRILIASDSEDYARRVSDALAYQLPDEPPATVVSLELAADRASRVTPDLLVIVLPEPAEAGLACVRDTCHTVNGTHLLVIGPANDPKLILAALHEGADEYLDRDALEHELTEALVRLKIKRLAPAAPARAGKVIACLAPSGGCGSSTVAVNVSTTLAGKAGQCGLIDLRLTAGDLAALLGLKPQYTMADLCDRLERVDQSMFEQFFVRHSSGVSLLAAPHHFNDISKVTRQAVRRTLALARVRFPYIVADLDNAFSEEQVEALRQADAIVLVLRLDYTSIRNVRRAMDRLLELGMGLERVKLVANGCGESKQITRGRPRKPWE